MQKVKETLCTLKWELVRLLAQIRQGNLCIASANSCISIHSNYTVSATDLCKRALVSLLKKLGLAYGVALEVTRDSTDAQVRTAFRKVS